MASIQALFPKFKSFSQPITDFIRTNPLLSGAALGIVGTTVIASATTFVRRRKAKKKTTKRKTTRKRKTNKRKSKTIRRSGKKRKIIRGRGLGTREIKHSGKSTKGKFKLVKFRDKRTGKMVSFKARI